MSYKFLRCSPVNILPFKGEKISVGDLRNTVGQIGVEVNDKEYVDLLERLPFDGKLQACS
jgi:hypothetical protein